VNWKYYEEALRKTTKAFRIAVAMTEIVTG